MVPFLELTPQNLPWTGAYLERLRRLIRENRFVGGEPVETFEASFSAFCGVEYCVGLNSGTDALKLGLQALGVGPADEVITSPFTFIATAEAVRQVGRLAFADIDPDTFTLSPRAVEEALTPQTRVVLPVHIFGLTADMTSLTAIAREKGLLLFEDACQAHGAAWDSRAAGAWGDAAAFSFYPTKNLGAFGDAGALVTNRKEVAERVRLLRNHGQVAAYLHEFEGWNSRLDAFQAAILHMKLARLATWKEERRRLAAIYRDVLEGTAEIRFQRIPGPAVPVYHLLVALVEERERLQNYLADQGVETRIMYPVPLHLQPAYRELGYGPGDFPVAESVAKRALCLPLYPGLQPETVEGIARRIKSFFR